MLHAFARAYGWSVAQLDEISFGEALTQWTLIDQREASDILTRRAEVGSAIASCFSGKQDDSMKHIEQMAEFDPDAVIKQSLRFSKAEKVELKRLKHELYPHIFGEWREGNGTTN